MKKYFIIIVTILLIPNFVLSVYFLYQSLVQKPLVHAANSYQRPVTITNSTGGALTNWAVKFIMDTTTLISANKMRSDCGDLRIIDSNNITPLNYYIDGGSCNSTVTRFWTRVGSLPVGSKTVFLQYGDLSATPIASGALVFDIYDSMQSTPACTLKSSAVYDGTNKWVRLTAAVGSTLGYCEYSYNPGSLGMIIKMQFWSGGGTGADASWFYAYDSATPTAEDILATSTTGYHMTYDEYQKRACFTKSIVDNGNGINNNTNNNCTAGINQNITTLDNSTWHTVEGRIYQSGANYIGQQDLDNSLNITNGTDTAPGASRTTGTFFGFGGRTGGQTNEHRVREVAMTKFNPLVTSAVGGEIGVTAFLSFEIRDPLDVAPVNICDLGTAFITATSSCNYRLKVTSNATNGYDIYSKTSGNLTNQFGDNIANAQIGPTGSLITNTTAGTENYGVLITAGSITGVGSISASPSFGAGANSVQFNNTTAQIILTSPGVNGPAASGDTTNTSLITHNLNIRSDTVSGDYTQSVIYTVSPKF